jgi:hypothetical protein
MLRKRFSTYSFVSCSLSLESSSDPAHRVSPRSRLNNEVPVVFLESSPDKTSKDQEVVRRAQRRCSGSKSVNNLQSVMCQACLSALVNESWRSVSSRTLRDRPRVASFIRSLSAFRLWQCCSANLWPRRGNKPVLEIPDFDP